jgi:hypothetical protein
LLQFAIKFKPLVIKNYEAKVFIKLNKKIYWVFPISGMTESESGNKELTLKTKCGVEYEK